MRWAKRWHEWVLSSMTLATMFLFPSFALTEHLLCFEVLDIELHIDDFIPEALPLLFSK